MANGFFGTFADVFTQNLPRGLQLGLVLGERVRQEALQKARGQALGEIIQRLSRGGSLEGVDVQALAQTDPELAINVAKLMQEERRRGQIHQALQEPPGALPGGTVSRPPVAPFRPSMAAPPETPLPPIGPGLHLPTLGLLGQAFRPTAGGETLAPAEPMGRPGKPDEATGVRKRLDTLERQAERITGRIERLQQQGLDPSTLGLFRQLEAVTSQQRALFDRLKALEKPEAKPIVQAMTTAAGELVVAGLDPQTGEIKFRKNLGATRQESRFNLGEFRRALALRKIGKTVDDPSVQALTPDEAGQVLQSLSSQDFLTTLLGGAAIGGQAATPTTPTPPAAEESRGFLQRFFGGGK